MTDFSFRPENCGTVMPYLVVEDLKQSVEAYTRAFGFKLHGEPMVKDGVMLHAEMTYLDVCLMFGAASALGADHKSPKASGIPSPMTLYVYTPDVDALYKQALAAGFESIEAPQDMFWGDRMGKVRDLNGYEWGLGTKIRSPEGA